MSSTPRQYFLRTCPLSSKPNCPSLYLRLHGSGHSSVVLTPSQPIYLRAYLSEDRQLFTSTKRPNRSWGLVMGSAHPHVAWEDVRIEEGETDGGFKFVPLEEGDRDIDVDEKSEPEEGKEMLLWDSRAKNVAPSEPEKGEEENDWKGWMVCEWVHGHPQLFWLSAKTDAALPSFCDRVAIV